MTIVAQSLASIEVPEWMNESIPSGIKVLDELVNGEGIHPGQVVTISANRGAGKTTLLLQMLNGIAITNPHTSTLYVSREEPSFQLKKTAQRIGVNGNISIIGDETDMSMEEFIKLLPSYSVVVLDSFSLIHMDSSDGSKMKVLKDAAKEHQCALIIVLHKTKSGTSKGSSDIEHLCDSVIDIERGDVETFGDDKTRIVEVSKNRFGSCGQVILKLERGGWDFQNPIEAKSINEDNKTENARNSAQAKKPKELAAILEIATAKTRITFADINPIIPADDSAAIGRFERHLKELEKYSKLIKIGRGTNASWEIIK